MNKTVQKTPPRAKNREKNHCFKSCVDSVKGNTQDIIKEIISHLGLNKNQQGKVYDWYSETSTNRFRKMSADDAAAVSEYFEKKIPGFSHYQLIPTKPNKTIQSRSKALSKLK